MMCPNKKTLNEFTPNNLYCKIRSALSLVSLLRIEKHPM